MAIMAMPIGRDRPVLWTGTPGARLAESSRSQTPNLATTKPRLMTAILVLIHARNVRSLARNSDALFSSGIVAFIDDFIAPIRRAGKELGQNLRDVASRRLLLGRDARHYLGWIWLVRQCRIIISVVDGIGANRVVQISNATLIHRRQSRVGTRPRCLVRIPKRDRLSGARKNHRVVRGILRHDRQPDGARAHDRGDYEPSIHVLHILSLRLMLTRGHDQRSTDPSPAFHGRSSLAWVWCPLAFLALKADPSEPKRPESRPPLQARCSGSNPSSYCGARWAMRPREEE